MRAELCLAGRLGGKQEEPWLGREAAWPRQSYVWVKVSPIPRGSAHRGGERLRLVACAALRASLVLHLLMEKRLPGPWVWLLRALRSECSHGICRSPSSPAPGIRQTLSPQPEFGQAPSALCGLGPIPRPGHREQESCSVSSERIP